LELFPECDFAVLSHGFAPHGRDYFFTIQNCLGPLNGTYEVTFTHCVECKYITALKPATWRDSWAEIFTNYSEWEKAGEPSGYVWGTNWSNAYPGISNLVESEKVLFWSNALEKKMSEIELETDRFIINLIFHDIEIKKINENNEQISSIIVAL